MPRPTASKTPAIFLPSFLPEFVRDGQSPIPPEVSGSYLDTRRSLAALILAPVHQTSHPYDHVTVKTHSYDLVNRQVILHISLQDRVEYFVWGQGIGVFLVRPQFSRRRLS